MDTGIDHVKPSLQPDTENYKRIAIKRYLEGELDAKALSSILTTLESNKKETKPVDLAYQ